MAEQTQQQIIIHTQYIKDFSFENPNAPAHWRVTTGTRD